MYILYKYYVQFVSIFPKLILPHTGFMDVGLLKVCLTSKDQGKELRILSFFCLVWWSSLSALGSYIPWSSLYCWCTWCTSDHLLCSSSAGFWLLYPVPVYLDNVLIFIPICVSLLPSPVCFVFVFEFCQLLLVQPFRSSTMFTHSHGVWHVQFLRLKEDIPEK